VVEDIWCRGYDSFHGSRIMQEVRGQDLDGRRDSPADGRYTALKVFGAPIWEVVASDRSYDNVPESQPLRGFGESLGFVVFRRVRMPARHGTETARTGADITQDHEGRRLARIAFHAVGAFGVVADGFQPQIGEQPGREMVAIAPGNFAP
jgi:hypothetical protein